MIDVAAWVQRAKAFIRSLADLPGTLVLSDSIDPPATDDHHREWLESAKCSLPPEIQRFLLHGSKHCVFFYEWTPPAGLLPDLQRIFPGCKSVAGGANLCEADRYSNHDNQDWFQDFFKNQPAMLEMFSGAGMVEDRSHLLVLAPRIGDQELALELSPIDAKRGVVCGPETRDRPPVKVCQSFEQFLSDWERIGYLTPTLDSLRQWLDPDTGLLRPDETKLLRLRVLFAAARARRDGREVDPHDA
jgi:hypothetical protein